MVSFSNEKPSQPIGASEKVVFVSQVVTEAKLIDQSNELENAIKSQNFADFCRVKADSTSTQSRRYVWYFLQSFFLPNPRSEMINLLGYKEDEFTKLSQEEKSQQNGINHLSNQMAGLNRGVSVSSNIGSISFFKSTRPWKVRLNLTNRNSTLLVGYLWGAYLQNLI